MILLGHGTVFGALLFKKPVRTRFVQVRVCMRIQVSFKANEVMCVIFAE